MADKTRQYKTDIGWSSPDKIVVKGFDLPNELLGKVDFGGMAFLEIMDRLPTEQEAIVFNALLVALVEHGITPSSLATRLTHLGSPDALQASVAAGLLGLGTVFVGSMEGSAKMLQEAISDAEITDLDFTAMGRELVAAFVAEKNLVPGLGHPVHKPIDPRTPRLFEIAAQNGFSGAYVALMQAVQDAAEAHFQRDLPINATGAIGAVASELGIPWQVCRGLGVMARAVGLVGHILEETRQPIARDLWLRTEAEATEHLR
ncbi:MAG: citryl-CoA lyase [Chloroflexota bacterium]